MIIRRAEAQDSPGILALRNMLESVFWSQGEVTDTDHAQWFSENMLRILVLYGTRTGVSGYVRISPDGRVALAITPGLQNKGFGQGLLRAVEVLAKEAQIGVLFALVHPSNIASMRTFMHAGYRLRNMEGIWQRVEKSLGLA